MLEVLSPDCRWKASAGPDHTLLIWKIIEDQQPRRWTTYTGHQDGLYRTPGTVTAIVWSDDGTHLISGSDNGSIHLVTRGGVQRGKLRSAQDNSPVTSLHLLPDGILFAYSGKERIGTWEHLWP